MNNFFRIFQKKISYLASFFVGEVVFQLLLVLKSFIILRVLVPSQYAEYSVFVSITTTFIVLGSGTYAGSSLLKFISECKKNKQKLSNLAYSIFAINKYYILIIAPFVAGFLSYSLIKIEATTLEIVTFVPLAILFVASNMYINIHKIYLVESKRLNFLNKYLNIAETAKIFPLVAFKNLLAFGSVSLCLIFTIINLILARSLSTSHYLQKTFNASDHTKYLTRFRSLISPVVPGILFSTVQSQLPVFIALAFGNVQTVAEVGALSKLSLIYSFMFAFNSKVLSPFIARSEDKNLKSRYLYVLFFVLFFAGAILTACLSFPNLLLKLLGENYYNIDAYKWIIILGSVNYINQSLWAFNSSQHWIYKWMPFVSIPGTIIIQIVFIYFNSMSEPTSIFQMMTFTSIFTLINRFLVSFVGLKRSQMSVLDA